MMLEFEKFPIEGIKDFYDHIISLKPIRNYYLHRITIIKTFYGKSKKKIEVEMVNPYTYETYKEKIPFTGAGACGYSAIVEKVYFSLHYLNINWEKSITKRGLYVRGVCSLDNRTGGFNIKWKKQSQPNEEGE